jgi:serine/threonine-protein kinase
MNESHVTTLQPGTVIGGKYEVVKCLGAGSMGMVYACRHRDLQGQLVAAKVLFNEVASDKVAAARFKNEILASYGVSHPNVVRAYEFIKDGDLVAYTMEFIGGGDLADRMSRPELLSIAEIIRLLSQMTAGVQAIHDAGIVHRDLKPENILLTNEGTVKIADFGIARKTDGPKLTEHGGVVGTLEYVSPEYMLRSQVDWRSDIYAIGVLAYELITGEPPFKGDSAYASISRRLQTDPYSPSRFRVECPIGLDKIVLKALQRDPDERYQSAMEMFYDLQQVAAVLGIAEASSSGILIPPASMLAGKRYVGPTLSKAVEAGAPPAETQFLTSDGSIDFQGVGPLPSGGVITYADADDESRERQSTDYLEPADILDRLGRGRVRVNDTEVPLSGAGALQTKRYSGAKRVGGEAARSSADSSSVDDGRSPALDMLILFFAALSGVGVGYLFLRLIAPSFLAKIGVFGLGS